MDDVKGLLQSALAQEEPSTQTLFYTVTSMSNLGMASEEEQYIGESFFILVPQHMLLLLLLCLFIFYLFFSSHVLIPVSFFVTVDNTTVLPALLKAVESEESPLSYGRAFLTASLLPDADLSELFDQIEVYHWKVASERSVGDLLPLFCTFRILLPKLTKHQAHFM